MNIDTEQVTAELERILNSPRFRSRKLIREFLHYTVQETLAGRGDDLNQHTIAIHALGKPDDFSPVYNPVVRIEAGRLRKLLQDYYAENGNHSQIIISIPKGSYQARFQINNQEKPDEATNCAPAPALDMPTPHVTEGPRVAVHCTASDAQNPDASAICRKLHTDLLMMMGRFRNIRLVSANMEACPSATLYPSLDYLQQHRVDYILGCNIQMTENGTELFCTLMHIRSNELIWTDIVRLPMQPAQADLDVAYLTIAANTIALHSGKALFHWAGYLQSLSTSIPPHQQVLVNYLAFLRDISSQNFSIAFDTCLQRLESFPDDSKALVILARLCGYDHVLQYNLVPDMEAVWTHAARMAMKLDPGSAESHSVFAHNCFFRGDYTLCRAEFDIARMINPFDTSIEYLYAFGLYMTGSEEKGIQSVNALLAIPFAHPDWYNILPFLHAFNQGNYREALGLAERIQQFGQWGELARCVSYFRLGQADRSMVELQKLLHYNPQQPHYANTDQRSIFAYKPLKKLFDTVQEIKCLIPA